MKTSIALLFPMLLLLAATTAPSELLTSHWNFASPHPGDAAMRYDDGRVAITVSTPCDPFWKISAGQIIADDLPRDHILQFTFRARSQTNNPIRAVVEQAAAPYHNITFITPTLTADWQNFQIQGDSPAYGKSGVAVRFQAGQQAGTIELANIHFRDLGTDPAVIAATAAIRPEAIAARIDRYRKRTVQFHILDSDGKPLAGAHVSIDQIRHAFWFGCNCFELDVAAKDPLQLQYQARFADLFNYATLPFYWGSYEPTPGHTDEARLKAMATWCRDHRIVVKGHPLIYTQVYPAWAPKEADPAIQLLQARVNQIITHFDGLINVWDVVNEANDAQYYPTTGIGAWANRDGAPQMVGTALQWARSANPAHETFLYNDYDRTVRNLRLLHWLADHQQLPDVIGIQSHMHDANWRPQDIWATVEKFSIFNRPIHFTETTIVSGQHRRPPEPSVPYATDWKSTPAGEAEQAAYIVQFYSILFSHPSLRAITWWDFSDRGAWLGAPAGLLRQDNSPKPAYTALMRLIHHDWWTNQQLDTDAAGNCHSRVFCGDYVITITDNAGHRIEKSITVPISDSDLAVTLQDGSK